MSQNVINLGEDNIKKLIFKLATPAIIAQLVNMLYNIIDRIFIGKMVNGDVAIAGVGIVLPIILLISSFSALIGLGGAPLVSIKMGENKNDKAEEIMGSSFFMLIITSIILFFVVFIFKENIL